MNKLKRILASLAFASSLVPSLALASPHADTKKAAKTSPAARGTIVDVAVADGRFKTLTAALQAAGLVDTLAGKGPFTVFAPTDDAFAKIPKADLDALLKDKAKLIAVLTYHVVPGKLMAADVTRQASLKTVQGGSLAVSTAGGPKVDGAGIIVADVPATNGVIHAIDSVVLPK